MRADIAIIYTYLYPGVATLSFRLARIYHRQTMRFIALLLLFLLSLHATALPTLGVPLENRDVSCTGDPSIPYDSSCYGVLGISAWLQDWNQTTQRCSPAQNGSDCCGPSGNPNEPWSTCFLRLSLANADYDCSQISIGSCGVGGAPLAKGISDTAQTRYVIRNLFCKFGSLERGVATYCHRQKFMNDQRK